MAQSTEGGRGPRVLAIANQKGGVGKTTTAINLGTALAAIERSVLIVDLDPQGNATTGLGLDKADVRLSTYDALLGDAPMSEVRTATAIPNLSVAPAHVDLAGFEAEMGDDPKRPFRLRDTLQEAAADVDFVLIDCPPSLNLLTVNAMTAADAVLVPMQCEFFALEGLSQLLRTIDLVRKGLNPRLEIQGVVLTMYDSRNRLSDQVAADVRGHLGDRVYETVIPRNVRVSEAPSYGKPALLYDHKCAGSRAYIALAGEMIRRERRDALEPAE